MGESEHTGDLFEACRQLLESRCGARRDIGVTLVQTAAFDALTEAFKAFQAYRMAKSLARNPQLLDDLTDSLSEEPQDWK